MSSARTVDDPGSVVPDTAAIADVLRSSPDAPIGCYDGWTVTDLVRHVGQIHRWVTGVVASRAQERPAGGGGGPPVPDTELATWLVDGASTLVDVLTATAPTEEVWTISRHDRDVAFWRRRMVLETALHRWDAQDAAGREATVDVEVAAAGVEETLDVYLAQRLGGAEIGGDGQRVAFAPDELDTRWTLRLSPDAVDMETSTDEPDAVVAGPVLELWLLLTCRRGLEGLRIRGDRRAAELAARAATLSPGPAD